MSSITIRTRAIALVASAMLATSGAAIAQQAIAPEAPQQVEIAPVSDTEISQFVSANRKVVEIANTMTLEIENAETPDAAQNIRARAEDEMVAHIESEGLTADRYSQIALLAQNDPAFLAKLQDAARGG